MIKEAFKTGLTGIAASDDLVSITLDKCLNEVRVDKNRKTGKWFITPWVYRLGAPLAAGALLLILFFGGNQLFSNRKASDSAPQTLTNEAASGAAKSAAAPDSKEKSRSAAAPEIAFSEEVPPAAPSEGYGGEATVRSFAADVSKDDGSTPKALNSMLNRTSNKEAGSIEGSMDLFETVVNTYNSTKGTRLTLDKTGITRVRTLLQDGINAESLKNAGSYNDILSDEGYWALPLKNSQGYLETIVDVNTIDKDNPNMSVSSSDIPVKFNNEQYLVSEQPSGILYEGNNIAFDVVSIRNMVLAQGYKSVSEAVIADINYGKDFLAFMNADGKEIAVPVLTSGNLFGLENRKIYNRDELFKVIINNMQP
jgi:hypothetical protein